MKIIEVINSINYRGGAQTLLDGLVANFKKQNHDVLVISLYGPIDKSFEHLNIICCNKKSRFDFKSARRFRKIVKEFNPDVIHFHLSCLATYFFAFGFKKRNWKLFETIHTLPTVLVSKFEVFLRKIFVKINNYSLIAISSSIKKLIDDSHHKNFPCVFNGIQLPICKYTNNKKYDFIIVAHMSEWKNHKLLFDVVGELKKEGKDLTVLCVGDGELLEQNKQYSQDSGLANLVTFVGAVNDCSLYYNESKIFILTSLFEGNPMTILEAMSFGLPIIAPRVGGIPDVVTDNVNGFVFEVNNRVELKEKMQKLISDNELYDAFSKNNLRDIQKYTIENAALEYIHIFESYINK
ncbi:MAG: glycosyltransferase family 4 protein [Bacilli bacterium]|nr:glycosyltransferase family 4 protein [Bacilli bacterium]